MPVSFSTLAPSQMELTPVRVTFKGIDLGGTKKNATVSIEAMKAEIKADQLGDTTIDRRVSGHKFTVTTEITEFRNKDNWKVVFPWMAEVVSGGNKAMYASSQIGRSDLADAGVLLLHPLSLPDADFSGDLKFYLAIAEGKSEIVYGPGEQITLKIVWNILPDTSVVPARFMFHGDTAIGLVAATAGSPSFVGTGNGTMTGVAVYSGITVTESIVATAVTAVANGGVFNVNGSVSGPLGLATVGIAFTSSNPSVISFTINDGATDFIVGDAFTIATTAANYA